MDIGMRRKKNCKRQLEAIERIIQYAFLSEVCKSTKTNQGYGIVESFIFVF